MQRLKTSEIITPKVVVNAKGLGSQTRFPNQFDSYVIHDGSIVRLWKNDPLQLYVGCLNFALFCATSGLGIALEHFKASPPLAASIARFHLYYHARRILYTLKVKVPSEKGFDALKTNYDREAYNELYQDYGVNSEFNWSNEYVFRTQQGSSFMYLNADSWSRWIMPKSQGLTKQDIEILSESIRVYVYCLLTAQSSTRSNIIGNTGSNFEAQKLFAREVEDFVKRDILLYEDIKRYENILSNARSSVDCSLGLGVYILPSDLQLKVAKKQGFSNKLKVGQISHARVVHSDDHLQKSVDSTPDESVLTLRDQRLSKDHQDELQSLVLFGSLGVIGFAYFLKIR